MCIGIAVGVVVYQPDYPRFLNCIETIIQQAGKVYVFDNGCDKTIQQEDFPEKVVYLSEGRNCGIPYALNRIMELASRDGYEWVVTMDQDSLLPEGLIEAYSEVADRYKEKGIGIICPCVVDKKRGYVTERHTSEKEEYISECITSAACTSIQAWEKVGKYDEWLFIDLVDNEFCKRAIVSGYKILRLNDWELDQEFGKTIPKKKKIQNFWIMISKKTGISNFAKLSYKKIVNPMRIYYTNRNLIYVNKKMRKYGKIGYSNYGVKGYLGFLLFSDLPNFLVAEKKWQVFRAIVCGMYDGVKKKVEPWSAE